MTDRGPDDMPEWFPWVLYSILSFALVTLIVAGFTRWLEG